MTYSESHSGENQTLSGGYILVGFSYLHELQLLLFPLLLVIYLLTLMGNLLIILAVKLSPSLHTPMCFFLVNLSVLEICYTTSVVPQLLVHLLEEEKTISLVACAAQMFILSTMGFMECCLLAAMAYDRYVAICHPLRYTAIVSGRACARLVGASWVIGVSMKVAEITWTFSLSFCGSNRIPHFLCDIPPVLKMACTDISRSKMVLFTKSVLFITSSFLLILLSYIRIVATLLQLPSVESRRKAFSTCSSHLTVVTFFYGTALFSYLVPKSSSATEGDLLISLMNTVLIPLLNPVIYALRNKEVKGAIRKLQEKSIFSYSWKN